MSKHNLDVWVVDDDASIRWVLEQSLRQAGMNPTGYDGTRAFFAALGQRQPDVVVTDIRMPDMDGFELLEKLRAGYPDIPVIVITAHADLDAAVSAYRGGAFEYLPKPFDIDEAVSLVQRAGGQPVAGGGREPEAGALRDPLLIGRAPSMQEVFRAIGRLSRSSMTVLITGESGTGKELVAAALHRHSPRASKPFIALNTSAIPPDLLESELFGHERGAFTGAESRRVGRFEQADGGTLFLDEIGDMSNALQTRLLRVLAEGEFYRVGGQTPIKVDVRVVAATHQDLEKGVEEGRFRADLFHRLNVIRVLLPPLRERREDIAPLLAHYLAVAAAELGTASKTLSPAALARMERFDWPGNVRQLVNTCRRITALAPGDCVEPDDLPPDFGGTSQKSDDAAAVTMDWQAGLARWASSTLDEEGGPLLSTALPEFERTLIRVALNKTGGNRRAAALLLGWGRNTLTRKIQELED